MVLVPVVMLIKTENMVLHERRSLASDLHDEMQPYIWEAKALPVTIIKETKNNKEATFSILIENQLLKGCVEWDNAKMENDKICLYGSFAK